MGFNDRRGKNEKKQLLQDEVKIEKAAP